ncbi:MAG: GreA/GreB family elongation factor [Candidatus Dormibacteraceae bacterium]
MDLTRPVLVTRPGLEKLERELEKARARRAEAVDRLREANQPGDPGDNPEYEEAKVELDKVDGRIYELEELVGRAQLIEDEHRQEVRPGSTVEVTDQDGEVVVYHLVGGIEADPTNGLISIESPVGRALIDKRPGDRVWVEVPAGSLELTIMTIR